MEMFRRFSMRKRLPSLNTFNVITLDGRTILLNLDTRSTGKDLLDTVLQECGMTSDKNYFSLALQEDGYQKWIIMQKPLKKQLSGSSPYTVLFQVYIYPINHQSLFPLARHFLYLQIKQDLQLNRLQPSSADVINRITALIMQGESGNNTSHLNSNGYSKELENLPNMTNGMDNAIQQAYRLNRGLLPKECEEDVLDMVQEEFTYGTHYYDIQDAFRQPVTLCVCPDGVRVTQGGQKVNCMKWETIIKINNKGKHIYFDVDASQTLTTYQAHYVCKNKIMAFNIVTWCQTLIKFYCTSFQEEENTTSRLKRLFSVRRSLRRRYSQTRTSQFGRPSDSLQRSYSVRQPRKQEEIRLSTTSDTESLKHNDNKMVIYGLSGLASIDAKIKSPVQSPTTPSMPSQIIVSMPDVREGDTGGKNVLGVMERAEHDRKVSGTSLHVIQEDPSSNFGTAPFEPGTRHDKERRGSAKKIKKFITSNASLGMETECREMFDQDQWQECKVQEQQFTSCAPPGEDSVASTGSPVIVIPPRTFNVVDVYRDQSTNSQEQDFIPFLPSSSYPLGGSFRSRRDRTHQSNTLPLHSSSFHHQHRQHNHQYPLHHQMPLSQHSLGTPEHQHRNSLPTPMNQSSSPCHPQQSGRKITPNSLWQNSGHPSSLSQPHPSSLSQPSTTLGQQSNYTGSHSQSLSQPHPDNSLHSTSAVQQYLSPTHETNNHRSNARYHHRHSLGDTLPGYIGAGSNSCRAKNMSPTIAGEPNNYPSWGYSSAHHHQNVGKKEPQSNGTWEEDEDYLSPTVTSSTLSLQTRPEHSFYEEDEEREDVEREKSLRVPSSSYRPRRGSLDPPRNMHEGRLISRHKRTRTNSLNTGMVPLSQQYLEGGMSRLGSIVSLDHQANLAELSQTDNTGHFDPHVRSFVFEASQNSQGTEL